MRLGRTTIDVVCFSGRAISLSTARMYVKIRGPHGHRLRPHRHRTDPREGGLSEADQGRAHRRAVPAVRRVRPHREGRGGLLRRDRGHRHLEDPRDTGRQGDEDPRARVVLVISAAGPLEWPPDAAVQLVAGLQVVREEEGGGAFASPRLPDRTDVDPRSSPRGGPVTVLPEVQVPPASDAFRREAATHLHVTTVW